MMLPFAYWSANQIRPCSLMGMVRIIIFMTCLLWSNLAMAQEAELVKLDQLQKIMKSENEHILIVNFWATWCAPCLKELPLFEKLGAERKDILIKLVSMDMDLDPNPSKVRDFVNRKKIKSTVLILDERNPNDWIDKVDKRWSGALPATLVINNKNGKRRFVEKELHEGELEKLIADVL